MGQATLAQTAHDRTARFQAALMAAEAAEQAEAKAAEVLKATEAYRRWDQAWEDLRAAKDALSKAAYALGSITKKIYHGS